MERNSQAIDHNDSGNFCTHWCYLTFQRIERRRLGWGRADTGYGFRQGKCEALGGGSMIRREKEDSN